MKKFDQLLRDLGFNSRASKEAQLAFVRHLQRVSMAPPGSVRVLNLNEKDATDSHEGQQLEFDPEILGIPSNK